MWMMGMLFLSTGTCRHNVFIKNNFCGCLTVHEFLFLKKIDDFLGWVYITDSQSEKQMILEYN